MDQSLEVKLLDKDSLRQQVEVYISAFDSHDTVDDTIVYWERKHYCNPVHSSYVFGVFDKEKLVSINAYMPMHYTYGNKVCNVIQSCESGTIPAYRGKGIWSKVVKFAVEYFKKEGKYDFLIGFPNYENSYGGFIKMKWNHDADIVNYILIANGKEFIKSAIPGKAIPFGRLLESQRIRVSIKGRRPELNILESNKIDATVSNGFSLEVNQAFIDWKEKYKSVKCFEIVDSRGEHVANCMYFVGEYNGSKVVQLCNPSITSDRIDVNTIYAYCIREVLKKNPNAAFIRAWAMSNSIPARVYKDLFFLKSKHHNPFITYQLKNDVVKTDELRNVNNWKNLSFLDLD